MSPTTKGTFLFAAVVAWLGSGIIDPLIPLGVLVLIVFVLLWFSCVEMFK